MGPYTISAGQLGAFEALTDQVRACCRSTVSEGWTRGRKTLFEAVCSLAKAVDPIGVAAQPVNPDRISIPAKAGRTRPEDLLHPERAAVLRRYEELELPRSEWPSSMPVSCNWVSKCDEQKLRRALLASKMAVAISADSMPVHCGKPVVAGLFTVAHKASSDRLMTDVPRTKPKKGWSGLVCRTAANSHNSESLPESVSGPVGRICRVSSTCWKTQSTRSIVVPSESLSGV
jgi:hypothetical protein